MKAKSVVCLVVVLLALGAGWAFASPLVEERHIEPLEATRATEVVIVPELRIIDEATPQRWGTRLLLSNDSGYTIERFDLYNRAMAEHSPEAVNLLTAPLASGERVTIDLLSHLLLLNALAAHDEQPFFYTAIDSEGDYFRGEWDPARESWNVRITFDAYRSDFLLSRYPIGGAVLALVNRSGKSLDSFTLGNDGSANLLSGHVVPPGRRALIPRSLIEALERDDGSFVLYYTALDTEGGRYRGFFYPNEEAWTITIDERMLAGRSDDQYALYIENVLDDDIWFLYAMTGEEYLTGEWGDDILGLQIINPGESEPIELYESDVWAERLREGWEGTLYLVVETSEGARYLTYAELSADYPTMFVSVFEARRIGAAPAAETPELVLYNRTGGALWYLYAAASLDSEQNGLDEELLGDVVWNHDEWVSVSVDDLDAVEQAGVLRLYAVDPEGTVYAKSWAIGGERLIVFRPSDRVE